MHLPLISAWFIVTAGLAVARPACSSLAFQVTTTAENIVLAHPPDQNNAAEIHDYLVASLTSGQAINGTKEVFGSFTIETTYCQPPLNVKARRAVQLLVHGITYNKSMWDGLGFSDQYNWHEYATQDGYHTLAIDRLSHGTNPQHPDPFAVVQGPLHAEIFHQIITQLRLGTASSLIPALPGIIYVGHSYGSALGNFLSNRYPNDVDAYVLTGFSSTQSTPPDLVGDLWSAAEISPRFTGLPLGYLTFRSEAVRTSGFYDGAFDPALAHLDFQVEDTASVEEFLSPGLVPATSPYTGPVFVATGDLDAIYCNADPAACPGILDRTGTDLYPSSKDFGTFIAKDTGHTLSLHFSVRETLAAVDGFLDRHFPA